MIKLALEAPWYTYHKKIKALFERDPEIVVGEMYEPDDGCNYAFDIEITNHEKYLALDRVLPGVIPFGNVLLGIHIYDEENNEDEGIDLYETIFKGNPIVKDIQRRPDHTGTVHGYVRFWPEVIQFFDDDLNDFSGNWSGLAQDIAREVFEQDVRGVHFCTADVRENGEKTDKGDKETQDGFEKPLGEWP